jgi:hypothetical protein
MSPGNQGVFQLMTEMTFRRILAFLHYVKMGAFPAHDSDFLPVDLFQTHRQVILHQCHLIWKNNVL